MFFSSTERNSLKDENVGRDTQKDVEDNHDKCVCGRNLESSGQLPHITHSYPHITRSYFDGQHVVFERPVAGFDRNLDKYEKFLSDNPTCVKFDDKFHRLIKTGCITCKGEIWRHDKEAFEGYGNGPIVENSCKCLSDKDIQVYRIFRPMGNPFTDSYWESSNYYKIIPYGFPSGCEKERYSAFPSPVNNTGNN